MKDTQKSWLNLVLMALMAGAVVYLIMKVLPEPIFNYLQQQNSNLAAIFFIKVLQTILLMFYSKRC